MDSLRPQVPGQDLRQATQRKLRRPKRGRRGKGFDAGGRAREQDHSLALGQQVRNNVLSTQERAKDTDTPGIFERARFGFH